MIYLELQTVLDLHAALIDRTGGTHGARDLGLVQSALAQPQMTMFGADLYPTLIDKATALGYSLICNHAFVDGNKRIGYAAMETFLVSNDHEIVAPVDEAESIVLQVGAGALTRDELAAWLQSRVQSRSP